MRSIANLILYLNSETAVVSYQEGEKEGQETS